MQKIDGTTLDNHGIVVAAFSMMNKANQVRFFEKIFLVTNVSPEVVFEIFFLTLIAADIDFLDWELYSKTYIIEEALPTIKRIQLVDPKEFAAIALNPEHETFIVHVASLSSVVSFNSSPCDIHPFYKS